jgi:hypothetical protein
MVFLIFELHVKWVAPLAAGHGLCHTRQRATAPGDAHEPHDGSKACFRRHIRHAMPLGNGLAGQLAGRTRSQRRLPARQPDLVHSRPRKQPRLQEPNKGEGSLVSTHTAEIVFCQCTWQLALQ